MISFHDKSQAIQDINIMILNLQDKSRNKNKQNRQVSREFNSHLPTKTEHCGTYYSLQPNVNQEG